MAAAVARRNGDRERELHFRLPRRHVHQVRGSQTAEDCSERTSFRSTAFGVRSKEFVTACRLGSETGKQAKEVLTPCVTSRSPRTTTAPSRNDGRVDEPTLEALERLQQSGRRLVLVTGRELDKLREVFPPLERFDRVVAENGALLFDPKTGEEKALGERPRMSSLRP